ncbi:MAG: methyltransferase domain-containing protein [Anaerolineae bacterium]|jgi:SAM-dependent methyltransferase|nr:methyltransferase domain-containing protein [Anaerolineae bacterium]MDH7474486.1 class I SAM-dependent methyltransferase [Anaerolineae bacterium]
MTDEQTVNLYRVPYHWMMSDFFQTKYEYPIRLLQRHLYGPEIVLDMGCGDGRLTSLLANKVSRVIGLDHQILPLLFARLLIQNNNVVLIQHDLTLGSLPLANNCLDLVSAFDVIEHIPLETLSVLLQEVKRVLKPSGKFVLTTPNKDSLRNRLWGHRVSHKHYFELNPRQLTRLLENAGFRIVEMKGIYIAIPIPKVEHYANVVPFRGLFHRLIPMGTRLPGLSETMFAVAEVA